MADIATETCVTCLQAYLPEDMDTVTSVLDFEDRRQCRHCTDKKIESWAALAAWCDAHETLLDPWKKAEEIGLDAMVRFYVAGQVLPCRKATAILRRTQVVIKRPKVWTEEELAALYDQAWEENREIDRKYNQELLEEEDTEIDMVLKETIQIAERSPVQRVVSLKDEKKRRLWKNFKC